MTTAADRHRLSLAARLLRPLRCGLSGAALALALAAGTVAPAPAAADPQGFAETLAQWLHGDEAESLRDLGELARAGDDDARLLLGLIDRTAYLQGPWLSRLPRDQRLALMRAPGGMSGQSWLNASDHPVAELWVTLLQVGAGLDTVAALDALGEGRAARQAVGMIAAREQLGPLDDWPEGLDPELAWLVWSSARPALRDRIAAMIPSDHPQRAMMGLPMAEGALDRWLADSPVAAPLRAICAADCAESQGACLSAAYQAFNNHLAVLTMGSPVESLIPTEVFATSLRGRRTGLRRMLLTTTVRGRPALIQRTREVDACLGDLLEAENTRFRMIRNGLPVSDGG